MGFERWDTFRSQFKGRLGGSVTFAALGLPEGGHFRSFRSFSAKFLPRAFATAFADFRVSLSRYLRLYELV